MVSELLSHQLWNLKLERRFLLFQIFIADTLENVPKNELIEFDNFSPVRPNFTIISKLKITNKINHADFVLVPHKWSKIHKNREYLEYLSKLSRVCPLIVVNFGDISPACRLPNTIQIREFIHPWENTYRKVIVPYPIKDKVFTERKISCTPSISFMGYVPRLSFKTLFGQNPKGVMFPIKSSVYLNRTLSIYKLRNMRNKFSISIVKRPSFSPLSEVDDFKKKLNEYNKSLSESNYVLCPRGFGNASMRFYETLSSGSTPILVDTNGSLPIIHDQKFWNENIIKVKMFSNWSKLIEKDWQKMSHDNNYMMRQKQIRHFFLKNLKIDVYLSNLFSNYMK